MFDFARALTVTLLALAMTQTSPLLAADLSKPMIRIVGSGEVKAEPDLVVLQTGVVSQAETAKQALDANSAQMTNVIDGLKAMGIAAKDLRTSNFSINPRYRRQKISGSSSIDGFEVRNTVSIVIRDVERVGEILDRATSLGANQFGGLQFLVDGADAKLDAARAEAIADARRKAEIYAKAAGAKLGAVVSIVEGRDTGGPRPFIAAGRAMAAEAAPIEPGETTLTVQVTVVWSLDD